MDYKIIIAGLVLLVLLILLIIFLWPQTPVVVVAPPPSPPADQNVTAALTDQTVAPPPTPCDYDLTLGIRAGGGRLVQEPAIECNDDPACLGYDTMRGYVFSAGDYYYEPDWKSGAANAGTPTGTYFKKSPGCRWGQNPVIPFVPECGWVRYDSMGIAAPTIEEMPATDMAAVRARCNELSNCSGYSVLGGAKVQLKSAGGPLEPMNGYAFVKQNPNCIGGTNINAAMTLSSDAACDYTNVVSLSGNPIMVTNSLNAAKLLCSQSAACGGISQHDALYMLYPVQDSITPNKFATGIIIAKVDQSCVKAPLNAGIANNANNANNAPSAPPPQYVFVPSEVPGAAPDKSIARIDARSACDADPNCTGYTYDDTLTSGIYTSGNNVIMERVFKPTMTSTSGTYIKVMNPLPACGYTNYSGEPTGQTIADVTTDPRAACDANPACKAYSTYWDSRQNAYTIRRLKSGIANLSTTNVRTYAKNNAACM